MSSTDGEMGLPKTEDPPVHLKPLYTMTHTLSYKWVKFQQIFISTAKHHMTLFSRPASVSQVYSIHGPSTLNYRLH